MTFSLGLVHVHLFADHEIEFDGTKVVEQPLSADSIALHHVHCPLRDLAEALF